MYFNFEPSERHGYDLGVHLIDIRYVGCKRCYLLENFHEVETDGGLFEGPGGRRQVNGLEGGSFEGFVERVFELEADVFI